jgi:aspartyl-tRNA(Asn)/glutamyl-tRNA(Gln) amidotransferase subunit C
VKITEKDVRYIAALGNLELDPNEVRRYAADLDSILDYVEKLNQLDTSSVEPMTQILYDAPANFSLRDDASRPGLPADFALCNAPESVARYFKVAKVIER